MRPKSRLLAPRSKVCIFFSGLPADNCGYFAVRGHRRRNSGRGHAQYLQPLYGKHLLAPCPRGRGSFARVCSWRRLCLPRPSQTSGWRRKNLGASGPGAVWTAKTTSSAPSPSRQGRASRGQKGRDLAAGAEDVRRAGPNAPDRRQNNGGREQAENAPLGRHAEFQEKHLPFQARRARQAGDGHGSLFSEARRGKGGYGRHLSGAGQPGSSHRQHCWTTAWPRIIAREGRTADGQRAAQGWVKAAMPRKKSALEAQTGGIGQGDDGIVPGQDNMIAGTDGRFSARNRPCKAAQKKSLFRPGAWESQKT